MGKGGESFSYATKVGSKEKIQHIRVSKPPTDFTWEYTDEPHATRRKLILAKYPQIKELYGHDPNTKYVILFLVALQLFMAYFMRTASWPAFLAGAYIVGGTANHMLMLGMHELSHNLCFRKMMHNKLFGLLANLPVGVPSSVAFKRYHMEHHRYQGEDGIDVDIPSEAETKIFTNTISKFFFIVFQVLFYALRPMFVNPKKPGIWEGINAVTAFGFDFLVWYFWGKWALTYLLLSTLLGSGLHPVAGHFISEHYVFIQGFETYSYYGILNFFTFNVGYHNEHHDFPFVAGSRLPEVRKMAPEFYDTLPIHDSWCRVLFDYIFDPNVNAFSRVKRNRLSAEETTKLKTQ